MLAELYADILRQEGFQHIGQLDYRIHLTIWWNPAPDKLLQVIVLAMGRFVLIKGDKSYYLKSVSAEGETWARDLGLLHDYLENHFPELRIAFSHFRDVPAELAQAEVKKRMELEAPTLPIPTVEQVSQLQRQLQDKHQDAHSMKDLMALSTAGSDLLSGYMHQQIRNQRAEIDQFKVQVQQQQERLGLFQHLQREYQRNGSAAVYSFGISSNIQFVEDAVRFADALRAVVKELSDLHRYQVMQKLDGGRLNIKVAEAQEPVMTWIEQWLGGALSPMQMRRLGRECDLLRQAADEHVMVTPDEPITVDGHVRHAEKHLAAKFLSNVTQRLDKTDTAAQSAALSLENIPAEAMPLSLGVRVDEAGKVLGPVAFPLAQMVHLYISGTTGGGKSFLARVLLEEAAEHKQLSILVLDPRNQSLGLLVREDRPKILQRYEDFGMKPERARGFGFEYFAPGLAYASSLPPDLSALSRGRSVVSFKGLDDAKRCALAAKVLDAVFEACNAQESDHPRLLVVVDEAQLFTRRRLDESAKVAAGQVERAIDRIAREGRKFGIVLALVSQTMKDFSYELASIRQMTTTKIFMRNSDREIEYAADIVGDGRLLVQLPTGTALVHNANWGVVRLRVRPPYSKVFELGEADSRRLVGQENDPAMTLSAEAKALFDAIKQHGSLPDASLNMSRAGQIASITSKRRLVQLIDELERAGVIRTRTLLQRGKPRMIELVIPLSKSS